MNPTRRIAEFLPALQRAPASSIGARAQCHGFPLPRYFCTGDGHAPTRTQLRELPRLCPAKSRCFSQTAPSQQRPGHRNRPNRPAGNQAVRASRWSQHPADRAILSYPEVYVVDPETNALTGPFESSEALKKIDLAAETIRIVQPSGGPDGKPVCRIFDREEERAKEQEMQQKRDEKAAQAVRRKLKIVELGWAIAPHDLEFKLPRLAKFLKGGHLVEVVFTNRKGMREVREEEKKKLIEMVMEELGKVRGAKQAKPQIGSIYKTLTLFWEGPTVQEKAEVERLDQNAQAETEMERPDQNAQDKMGVETKG